MSGNFDELLSAALSDAFDEEIRKIEQLEKVMPSEKLKGVVLSLCKKKRPRTVVHFQPILKRCAVFVLVFFSTASLLMLTAPEVRAAVQQVILKWTDKALEFEFEKDSSQTDAVSVTISYIPFEYTLSESFEDAPDDFIYTWSNEDGKEIYLSCSRMHGSSNISIDNEHGELIEIDFAAQNVVYIKSNESKYPNYLTWTMDEYFLLLETPDDFSNDTIIQIAESIKLKY